MRADRYDDIDCSTGRHKFFVVTDGAHEGKVFVILACTSCGEGKKLEFQIASKDTPATVSK